MVEMAVVETASENPLPQLSTSVSDLLGFPSGDAERQASPYGSLLVHGVIQGYFDTHVHR